MSKTYYWSCDLTPSYVSVCLWTREDEETSVVAISEQIPVSEGEYVASVDAALSSLASEVPEDAHEPEKTVFGVLNSWVSEGHIKKEYLAIIRQICGELSLSPVGFVVFPESIAHYVKQNEGGPLTAVVVAVGEVQLEVSLFKLGNPQGTVEVGRSQSVSESVVSALFKFNSQDPLPSRFIIFGANATDLGNVSSELSGANWEELSNGKLTFLHDPKIEMVDSRDELIAVSISGSSELGPVKKLVIPPKDEVVTPDMHANVSASHLPANDIGFVMDKDIAAMRQDTDSPREEVSQKVVAKLPFSVFHRVPVHTFGSYKTRGIRGKAFAFIFCILILAIVFGWYYAPHAAVTVFISPRILTTKDTFSIKTDISAPDISNKVIPAQLLSETVSDEGSAPATGTKTVGDLAKGMVTIRNGTSSDIKLPAGALLVSNENLKFTLDKSASVSAAISPSTPGTAVVPATASQIGADYNIAANDVLKVGSFSQSEIDGVVSTSFAGGSSRKINAVSKGDLDTLERTLTDSLIEKLKEKLSSMAEPKFLFAPDLLVTHVTSKTFDRKVGDEADNIGLSLTLSGSALTIPKSAIQLISQDLLSNQIPNGFTFRPEQTESEVLVQKGSSSVVSVNLTAHLLPNIAPGDVVRSIRGKTLLRAQEYLSSIPGFTRAAIVISPSFPGPLKVIPWVAKHISVSLEAEK